MDPIRISLKSLTTTLRDIYAYRAFTTQEGFMHYRGVYPTYAAAQAALPPGAAKGFDHAGMANYFADTHLALNPSDYPVMFWLSQILQDGQFLVDFGGGVGQCFYSYQEHFLRIPQNFRWTVCDLPALLERGDALARERGDTRIAFAPDVAACGDADIFLSCGTLQYLEPDLPAILSNARKLPTHAIVNRVPLYDGEPYFTIQHAHNAFAPYKIGNLKAFAEAMKQLDYTLVEQWYLHRSLTVPFHPDRKVPHYHGFYFRRNPA